MKGSSSLLLLLLLTVLLATSGGAWAIVSDTHAISKRTNINETTNTTTSTTTTTTTVKPRDSRQSKSQSRANATRPKFISSSDKKSSNDATTTTTESPLLRASTSFLELDKLSKASNEKKKLKKQQKDKQRQRPYKTNLPDSKIYYIKQKPNAAKPVSPRPDSPVHYIKLPPEPYVYDQAYGGYISRPPAFFSYNHPDPEQNSALLQVPVKFLSNGKPNGVYTLAQKRPSIQSSSDSPIIRLSGSYKFNGKPSRVYLSTSEDDQRDSPLLESSSFSIHTRWRKRESRGIHFRIDSYERRATTDWRYSTLPRDVSKRIGTLGRMHMLRMYSRSMHSHTYLHYPNGARAKGLKLLGRGN
ncbi:unnamed protein product [Trichogramma brassicae]|uniref:Uncharacterized protein n=1 Tax=Trichogramma brassicae TaxID=86971 RepID=A0A6H5IE43_9HYME|nr:unnamed protein product [Trichogramma brassicae]